MTILLAYPGNETLAAHLASSPNFTLGEIAIRHFPDGESHVRIDTPVKDKRVFIVCTLDQPNTKFLPLALLAQTARDLGASQIDLITPYLSYMRQDERFHPGEGISSIYVGAMLSQLFDKLWTIAPHLHRHNTLDALYSIPTQCISPTPALVQWVKTHVHNPMIIGPDEESEQWVHALALALDAPYFIFHKVRSGDRDVALSAQGVPPSGNLTPIILDDIISTGQTMAHAVQRTLAFGLNAPYCLGIHAVFSDDAQTLLLNHGARQVLTCDTITHSTNAIAMAPSILNAIH